MSVRVKINAQHNPAALKKKEIRSLHPLYPLLLLILKARLCLPFKSSLSYFHEPIPSPPPPPRSMQTPTQQPFAVYFSSSPIASAIICLFHFSLAELIGHVCTVASGPDIIAGQIARRLAPDQPRLSCAQTAVDWKA